MVNVTALSKRSVPASPGLQRSIEALCTSKPWPSARECCRFTVVYLYQPVDYRVRDKHAVVCTPGACAVAHHFTLLSAGHEILCYTLAPVPYPLNSHLWLITAFDVSLIRKLAVTDDDVARTRTQIDLETRASRECITRYIY